MRVEYTEALWIDEHSELSLSDLAERCGLSEQVLRELVDYGALSPVDPASAQWRFRAQSLTTTRVACRLQQDFELVPDALAVALRLMERIDALEVELRELRARTPRALG